MFAAEFIERLFGDVPELFKDKNELRRLWSTPATRKTLLEGLAEKGYGTDQLVEMARLINAEKSDLYDVLSYVAYATPPETRADRVSARRTFILGQYDPRQQDFLDFVLGHYIEQGVTELDDDKLPQLLDLKYHAVTEAVSTLGNPADIRAVFIGFQQYLYDPRTGT